MGSALEILSQDFNESNQIFKKMFERTSYQKEQRRGSNAIDLTWMRDEMN
jgi:hypothetical protein